MKKPVVSEADAGDLALLHVDMATTFVISGSGRIERENDPDFSPGPRLAFAGCSQGNIARVRHDVDQQLAAKLLAISAEETPWRDADVLPPCVAKIIDILSCEQPVVTVAPGVIFRLSNGLAYQHAARIVRGDSAEGQQMLARLAQRGLPQPMLDAGFKGVGDFWPPWCLALDGDQLASIAFAARIGNLGAEIGVVTLPKFRARGFAAAVTANWSSMPTLNGRALFYSTQRSNRSSRRVALRLGLRRIGASVRVG
jgi:hypothetical protein